MIEKEKVTAETVRQQDKILVFEPIFFNLIIK